jgi:hypothetical protein
VKRFASERHYRLAHAIADMAARYGSSMHAAGLAYNADGTFDGKPWVHYERAARRQFGALQRLTRALRDVEVSR